MVQCVRRRQQRLVVLICKGLKHVCVLSATQVLASAISKSGRKKSVSVGQLISYNDLILKEITDYFNTIDMGDLSFEVGSVAREFEIITNEDYERVIRVRQDADFDYAFYANTMPKGIAQRLEAIELPS